MKVKIGDEIYDSNLTPIMIIWDSDEERKQMGHNIVLMNGKQGIRKYVEYNPKTHSPESVREWMNSVNLNE